MKAKSYKDWERVLTKELCLLWGKSDKFLPCHGPEHHLRVWQKAEAFGRKKKADLEVLLAACLFHDAASFDASLPCDHAARSAKIAAKVLQKVRFPVQKAKEAVRAIGDHRSRCQGKTSLEAKIMKSFDKLEALGPIGVYRVLTPWSIRKYPLSEIVNWALGEKRLAKKWNSIPFPELKKKYLADYRYSVNYFKKLAQELKLSKPRKSSILEKKMYYE